MEYFEKQVQYMPYLGISADERVKQSAFQQQLKEHYPAVSLGKETFVSELAHLYQIRSLTMGDRSFIGADCLIRSVDLHMGSDCSINTSAYLQGEITMGSYVRIAPKVSIIAMNHGTEDPDIPIVKQPTTEKGITIGDDVWVGAGSIVLDGVTIGSHCVIGAGSVVTKDIPPYSVAVGNPAKVIRNRKEPSQKPGLSARLRAFCNKVEQQLDSLLEYYVIEKNGKKAFCNRAEGSDDVRPWCDAIEIAAMFDKIPPQMERDELVEQIQCMRRDTVDYHCLTVGYALEVLGSHIQQPFSQLDDLGEHLTDYLNSLPWQEDPWAAGAAVDHFATALYHNKKYFGARPYENELFGWLNLHVSHMTGMWGGENIHLLCNGFYRLTRGTYAQFDVPLPYPEEAVDTLLRYARNERFFHVHRGTACDTLDVIHPLWLCAKQTGYRKEEGERWAYRQIERILLNYQENRGFSFELETSYPTGLMGTEMWLSILYLLCDYVGLQACLTYQPKGVHRIQTGIRLGNLD